jgi:hypothetical protein
MWAGVGLAVKQHMASGSDERRSQARAWAHEWLERAGWLGDALAVKKDQLIDYVAHVHQLVDDLG